MFSEEIRMSLTHGQIKKDLIGDSYYKLAAYIGLFLITFVYFVFSANITINEIRYFDPKYQSRSDLFMAVLLALLSILMFGIVVWCLIDVIKKLIRINSDAFTVVEDQLEYITTIEEVRYRYNRRCRRRYYVTIDVLHFAILGEYKLNEHPTRHEGGDKFYIVLSGDGKTILNVYSQKTYYYRK